MHYMKTKNFLTAVLVFIIGTGSVFARENVGTKSSKQRKSVKAVLADGCAPATSNADLNINNVRTRILGSGDMWWDLNDAKYEVPKGSDKHSMFAGALWLGGIDEANNLKLAAMTYRQTGVDYWPGPLDDASASISADQCQSYNRHWIVYRDEVETHKAWIDCKADPRCNEGERFPGYAENIPESIRFWPGNGLKGELAGKLAPFFESDSGGTPGLYDYDYDYPGYDLIGNQDCRTKEVDILYGDQTIWWVYNDKGNVHTETQAGALGFEIRAQAFAFTSNDEVNNMTFNNYRIINKSTFRLTDTYFGTWFDPDLGNARDDIIGCDIARGLGYCYNADSDDEGPNGYGQNPPAIGFDFFQGPFADYGDGVDNDRDGCPPDHVRNDKGECIPENPATGINERIIMSGFMYYNNITGVQGNPDVALDYYNYLRSLWKNGNNLIIETPSGKGNSANGDGYVASNVGVKTVFAYPGVSYDTTGAYEPSAPVDWWESPANLNDKRGLHSAGPFSLAPGALNFITTGNVWARNFRSNDLFASVNDVIVADDKAQQLFDNCFDVLDGPPPVDVEIVELDRELIFKLGGDLFDENNPDNAIITYSERDISIPPKSGWNAAQIDSADKAGYFDYRFEGFQIFQVANKDVGVDNLYDPAQARLIFQSDLKNDVEQLINFEVNADFQNGALEPIDKTLETNNDGIELTYRLLEDAFATGDKRLINNKEYYFYVIPYAQNQYEITDPLNLSKPSQKKPYLAGRDLGNGNKAWSAIPHKRERDGKIYNSQYGDGLPITRFSGAGTSGNFVKLTEESRNAIVSDPDYNYDQLDYLAGYGPFDIKVVDPTKVIPGDYKLTFTQTNPIDSASWVITGVTDPTFRVEASSSISFLGEQIIEDLGVSVAFRNAEAPGDDTLELRNNGVVGGEQVFKNARRAWLTGVNDDDTYSPTNWILAGNAEDGSAPGSSYNDKPGDRAGIFETILGGTWAPVILGSTVARASPGTPTGTFGFGIKPSGTNIPLDKLPNIDVVITSDPSKWTRCPVIELGDEATANDGGTRKFTLRSGRTLNLVNGQLVPDADPNNTGWSYFPGYAVNVETGNRLSMAFGESSWLKADNGGDMIWNPSSQVRDKLGNYVMGGMHVVYVLGDSINITGGSNYVDLTYKGDNITDWPLYSVFSQVPTVAITQLFRGFAWASMPLVQGPEYEFSDYSAIPTDVTVSLRVAKPYQQTNRDEANNGFPEYGFSTTGSDAVDDINVAKSALDDIRVVPNPYYGSSLYEDSQLDNIVKITNLPDNCKINIFMSNGTLVRTFNKANTFSYVEWDLKNDFNVPIASGVYIIHIDAGELGEKVVKWMGSIRPVDLNAF